ncbi:MAG: DNA repair protein RadC [Candidatus Magnetomorum sp.]|nr:DNA repair protein RadC [Candidatus Magnetomorum sp.]
MLTNPTDDYRIGHRKRLRERFLKSGLDGFHDYEIVELLLTIGTPRKDVRQIAREVMKKFKTLSEVLNAPTEELTEIKGIGSVNVFGIKLIKAVADRCTRETIEQTKSITSPDSLFEYLQQTLGYRKRECFMAIMLNAKNKIIDTEIIFEGSLTSTCVYPREVIATILKYNAAAVIFAHNHPSGDPTPSEEDKNITQKLVNACKLMGVTVHEHMIVGKNNYFSFAEHGDIGQ